jgi:hypothetical protein
MKTKQFIQLAAIAILLCPSALKAQTAFGFRNGLVISTLSKIGEIGDNDNLTVSYTAGAFASFSLNKSFAVQTELNYQRKGRSNEPVSVLSDRQMTRDLDYLQLPVLLRYDFADDGSGKVRFFINAGPYASVLLHSVNRISSGDETTVTVSSEKTKNMDSGVVFGGGCLIPVKKHLLQLDWRYDMGLTAVLTQPQDYQTKALTLTAGIRF